MEEAEEFYARALDYHDTSLDALMHRGLFYEFAMKDVVRLLKNKNSPI